MKYRYAMILSQIEVTCTCNCIIICIKFTFIEKRLWNVKSFMWKGNQPLLTINQNLTFVLYDLVKRTWLKWFRVLNIDLKTTKNKDNLKGENLLWKRIKVSVITQRLHLDPTNVILQKRQFFKTQSSCKNVTAFSSDVNRAIQINKLLNTIQANIKKHLFQLELTSLQHGNFFFCSSKEKD